MITHDNFRILDDKEKSRYKFEFCQLCEFYPCEIVWESGSHEETPKIHGAQIPVLKGCIVTDHTEQSKTSPQILKAKAISLVHDKHSGDVITGTSCHRTTSANISRAIPLSYDQEDFKTDCIMSDRHVCQIECGQQRVSEGIGDHFKIEIDYDGTIRANTRNRWEPLQPVFISAQTGQGKNYFIENTLIPYVKELNYKNRTNQKILILSNRRALQLQMENRLKGNDEDGDSDNIDEKVYHYRDIADVMTYQNLLHKVKFLSKKQENVNSRYIYVICDESHFFTSDALFNPDTQKILSAIVRTFQDAVRVYMSATPYECLKYIINAEDEYKRLQLNWNKPQHKWVSAQMAFYHFKRNYDYLNIKTFSDIRELCKIIVESVNERQERWLVFIDDKDRCSKVKELILKYAETYAKENKSSQALKGGDGNNEDSFEAILAVDARSKGNEVYQRIIKQESLGKNTYVLISTSVLDNGVNLNNVNNIVVSDMSRTKCLQMVGRARVNGPDDRKTLYLQRFDSRSANIQKESLMVQQEAYHRYTLAYAGSRDLTKPSGFSKDQFISTYYEGFPKDWKNAKHWFGRPTDNPDKLYLNEIARSMVDKLVLQYRAIFDEMVKNCPSGENLTDEERKRLESQKYIEYQLSWFGKLYCDEDDVSFVDMDNAKKNFIAFLESYAESGKPIEGSEKMVAFQGEFTALYDAAYSRADKNKNRTYGYKVINNLLKELNIGYRIIGQPQKGPWTVSKADASQENAESE